MPDTACSLFIFKYTKAYNYGFKKVNQQYLLESTNRMSTTNCLSLANF